MEALTTAAALHQDLEAVLGTSAPMRVRDFRKQQVDRLMSEIAAVVKLPPDVLLGRVSPEYEAEAQKFVALISRPAEFVVVSLDWEDVA